MEVVSRGGKKDNKLKVGIIYSMLDRSFNKKNKAGKRVWCGGNSYHFRRLKKMSLRKF